ncbi:hypothetical protein H4684_003296 [Desulfomicrobium macestii]|uniref:TOTE conflict system primase domain-containing protein n=1 Tax=Desulfomicrobium macestii TaxID=90731 RepID=A0ABR9H7F2_9BACT|nr:CRISPR-associated primase-polymerase type A1 [Desulfomicrobium macestii]MBE1426630.1 hypothetical protein [Desulfomicrobium macestii]
MNAIPKQTQGAVQYDLLLDNLRQQVLTGHNPDKTTALLSRTELFEHLNPEQLLSWASCAQIAGNIAIAEKAFDHLHEHYPDSEEAWNEHRDYLQAMNDSVGLATLRAQCRVRAPQFLALFHTQPQGWEREAEIPDASFVTMNREKILISRFMEIFRGREDCFARQWVDKAEGKSGYMPVRRPMTEQDLREHLSGLRTFGIYLMQADGRVRIGVIDADLRKDLRQPSLPASQRDSVRRELAYILERIPALAGDMGLSCIVEFSGSKGYHFWFPFDDPVDPAKLRSILHNFSNSLAKDLPCFTLEVFPKQDHLSGKGLGNLVKLPLGIHRLSGKPSRFLPGDRGDAWRQLEKLEQATINSVAALSAAKAAPKATVVEHPSFKRWKNDYPELAAISAACPLLAGIFSLCREGRALSVREERVLFGVLGFLDRRGAVLHALLGNQAEYNRHLVDYRISRLRGTPLGCKKIHALLESSRDLCDFPPGAAYGHPLLFVDGWQSGRCGQSENVSNLQDALDQLRQSLELVGRFLPEPGKAMT